MRAKSLAALFLGAFVYVSLCGFFIFPIPIPKTDARKAQELAQARDWHGVINFTTEQLKSNPNNESLYDFRCLANFNLRRFAEAERDCQESPKILPNRVAPTNNLGAIRQYQSRHAEAIAYFEKAVAIQPNYGVSWANIVVSYNAMQQPGKAWDAFQELAKVDASRAKDVKTRLKIPDERPADLVAKVPQVLSPPPTQQSAVQPERAIEVQPGREHPQSSNRQRVDDASPIAQGDLQTAQTLVITEPSNARAWRELGKQYQSAGDTDKAIRAFQEALRLEPSDANTLETLGALYAKAGQKEKVRETWENLGKVDKARADKFFSVYILP